MMDKNLVLAAVHLSKRCWCLQ